MKKKKRKRAPDFIAIIIMIVAIGVFIYAAYQLYLIFSEYDEGENEYDGLREYVQMSAADDDADESTGEKAGDDEASELQEASEDRVVVDANEIPECPITVDLQSLKAINPDIIGWIYVSAIPKISYPVVQGTDNSYYLNHTVEGTENSSASIFIDYRNASDFSDSNTIIYGHNMKNQSMFGMLKHLKEQETFAKSPYIWVVTAAGETCYEIFSVRDVSETDAVYNTFLTEQEAFKNLLEEYQRSSVVDGPTMEFDGTEKIVTLSTCTSDDTVRCVVQAVRKEF